jgi:hypothetical protein
VCELLLFIVNPRVLCMRSRKSRTSTCRRKNRWPSARDSPNIILQPPSTTCGISTAALQARVIRMLEITGPALTLSCRVWTFGGPMMGPVNILKVRDTHTSFSSVWPPAAYSNTQNLHIKSNDFPDFRLDGEIAKQHGF